MEDRTINDWMVTSDPNDQQSIVDDLAGRVDLGLLKIPEVFRDLQPYLTSEDVPLPDIAHALSLFALVLGRLQVPIDRIDVHELTTYFCGRLENKDDINSFRAGVKECAQILSTLAQMPNKRFPPGDAKLVAQSVFAFNKSSNLRDQRASTRLSLLELMRTLMQIYKSNLEMNIGAKVFVEGIVAMAEFEKDPTCLNVLFPIYEILSKEWSLSEDTLVLIWDSFIRYYPIKIGGRAASVPSPDKLKQLLLDCFISNNSYAKFAFPRLIELLDTDQDLSANVKMDVLFTIAFAVNGYSTLEVSKWASSLWDALKFEVWNGENSDTIAASLSVITNIAKALSDPTADWANADIPSAKPLLSIITECNRRVADNRPENIAKTGSILHAIAEATPYAFSWVTRRFLPVMLTLWQSITSEDAKGVLLTVLNTILEARVALDEDLDKELSRAQEGSATDLDLSTQNAQIKNSLASTLVPFQRNLIDDVYFNAMTDNISSSVDGIEYRAATIRGLVVLMRIRNMLSDFEKGTIVEALNSILLQPKQIDSVKREAILGLQNMSSADPANFQTITLANFMNKLPKHIAEDGIQRQLQLEHVISLFDSLVQIACTAICNFDEENVEENVDASPPPRDRVFTAFQQAMMAKLVNILEHNGQLQYANIVLGAIYHGIISYDAVLELQLKSSTSPAVSARISWHHPYAWIVLEIYKHIVEVKQLDAKMPYVGFTLALGEDEQTVNKFVSLVGNITTLTLRSRQTTPKNNFLNSNDKSAPSQVWSLFINSAPESIDKTQMDLIGGPSEKLLANALSMSLVAGVRREDKTRLKFDIGEVALAMIRNATNSTIECSQYSRLSMLHFLQLLVNKFGAAAEKVGDRTVAQVMVELIKGCEENSNETEVERCYQALAYFSAASVARSDPSCDDLIRLMVDGLKHPVVGRKVAQSFRILIGPSSIMSEANFCAIRPLRQGRLFSLAVENIKSLWREYSFEQQGHALANEIKTNCLIALAGSLAYMDRAVYLIHVSTVLPLLLEGTNVQNDEFTKLSCIEIIRKLVPLCPDVVRVHLDSVINRMTDRTHNTYYSPSDASAACRVAAIDVLAHLPRYVDNADLVKRKTKIMAELDIALNDVSMDVRIRAQKCKMAYFNLES